MKLLSLVKAKPVASIVSGALVLATLAGGGVYLSQKKAEELKKTETTQDNTQTNTTDAKVPEQNEKSQTQTDVPATTPAPTPITDLNDVTLQGVNSDKGIDVTLYAEKGTFVVEKKVGNSWMQVIAQTSYLGSGGLSLNDLIPTSETQRVYRVYKVVDGKKVGPKEITVVRSVVIEKGSANFPSAGE